jgi:hypothetical protein
MPRAIVQFTCKQPGCDSVISETLWVSEPDYSAERMSDGDAIENHDVTCPECETDYEVETVNGMGGLYATLDGETLSTPTTMTSSFSTTFRRMIPSARSRRPTTSF